MAIRIPSSLNWLIDKRARLAGNIIKTKRALKRVQHLVNRLNKLESELNTIDSTLRLHEIQINVENIKPIREKVRALAFPHGYISKYVLEFLMDNHHASPILKSDIVYFLITKHQKYQAEPVSFNHMSDAVKQALVRNERRGYVVRHHPVVTQKMGKWQLSKKYIDIHITKNPPSR